MRDTKSHRSAVFAIASIAVLVPPMSAEAALPPYDQRLTELQRILASSEVQSRLME